MVDQPVPDDPERVFRELSAAATSTPSSGLRGDFVADLDTLADQLTEAATTVATVLRGDLVPIARGEAAEGRAPALLRVAELCDELEQGCFVLIARQAPVGRDLRRIVSILRLTGDTERSAILLGHSIEALTGLLDAALPLDVRTRVRQLAEAATGVFARGVDAWLAGDALAVAEIAEEDREVDDLQGELMAVLTEVADPTTLVALGLTGRYLERIADHGEAFAHEAAFVETGMRVSTGADRG